MAEGQSYGRKWRTTFAGIAMAGWRHHLEEVDHSSGTGRGRGARQRGAEPEEPGRGKRAPREEQEPGGEGDSRIRGAEGGDPREVHSRSRSRCEVGHGGAVESGHIERRAGGADGGRAAILRKWRGRLLRESQWPGGSIWRRWTTAAGRDAGGSAAARSGDTEEPGRGTRAPREEQVPGGEGDSRIRGDEGGDPRKVHSRSWNGCKVGCGGGVESGPHRKKGGAG
jgi:hypothetical protein